MAGKNGRLVDAGEAGLVNWGFLSPFHDAHQLTVTSFQAQLGRISSRRIRAQTRQVCCLQPLHSSILVRPGEEWVCPRACRRTMQRL